MAADPNSKATNPPETKYIFVNNPPVGPEPICMKCPHCHSDITTEIDYRATAATHTLCLIYSMLGCFLCAPCLYCNKDCMAKEHYCPSCDKFVGRYEG